MTSRCSIRAAIERFRASFDFAAAIQRIADLHDRNVEHIVLLAVASAAPHKPTR